MPVPQQSRQALHAPVSKQDITACLSPNPLSQFSLNEDELRLALVSAQRALRATRQQASPTPVKPTGLLVLVNGMEQAGKGTAVTQLRQWVDPRLLKVEATIGYPSLSHQPLWQAHIKMMPRHGDVMVYFGNWYADLLYNVMSMVTSKKLPLVAWQQYLQQQLQQLQAFERDLAINQTKLLKCWFHVDAETLQARLNDDEVDPEFLYQIDWNNNHIVEEFNKVAVTLLSQQGDWIIIDDSDKSKAATNFCHQVLQAMQSALASSQLLDTARKSSDECDSTNTNSQDSKKEENCKKIESDKTDKGMNSHSLLITDNDNINACLAYETALFVPVGIPKILMNIQSAEMDKAVYHQQLASKQAMLAKLLRARGKRHVVFAFEGMDAAGKGGAIKRLVAPLDPREYQIHNIGVPMLYELQHPYLWRFWTRLPNEQTERLSRIAIFDRTWYGRVLVERIEKFATPAEWQRAYAEINRFEASLVESDIIILKYWLAIDKQEQLQRFEERDDTPYKQFKLTNDDWRNRDKWQDYVQAAADMLARTHTDAAPWCVVASNDKRQARLQVLDYAIFQLKNRL
ncbi:ATPase [Psychrobacter sp. 16-MNA-CIBAN-0192]|uniref:ATPase n=1 Tax=Psychrobacter sp. 16-MNA-CIBAN-0192 TaxID=3140448 RepID=UPI00332AA14C